MHPPHCAPSSGCPHTYARRLPTAADDASCQALGNLCVLQHYNPAATVCQLVQRIVDTRAGTVNEWPGWATTMPFLQYKNDAEAVTKSLDLAAKMSFDAGTQAGTHEWAQFKLAKFSVNGTFLGAWSPKLLEVEVEALVEAAANVSGCALFGLVATQHHHIITIRLGGSQPPAVVLLLFW